MSGVPFIVRQYHTLFWLSYWARYSGFCIIIYIWQHVMSCSRMYVQNQPATPSILYLTFIWHYLDLNVHLLEELQPHPQKKRSFLQSDSWHYQTSSNLYLFTPGLPEEEVWEQSDRRRQILECFSHHQTCSLFSIHLAVLGEVFY